MSTVTVSSKYRVVIPRPVREALEVQVGQKIQVFAFDGRIELVPVRPVSQLRGILRGSDTDIERDEDRA